MNKWIMSLSDGQRLSEDKLEKDGLSAWTNLIKYLRANKDKEVIQVQLIVNGRRYNSPSRSKNSKFESNNVKDFFACRKLGLTIGGGPGKRDTWMSFSYRIGDCRHYFWVNEASNDTYVEVQECDEKYEKDFIVV